MRVDAILELRKAKEIALTMKIRQLQEEGATSCQEIADKLGIGFKRVERITGPIAEEEKNYKGDRAEKLKWFREKDKTRSLF